MLELMPPFYFLTFAKVSVSVSKKFGLKKSRYRSWKHLVSKKSLGISLENIWSRKKVSVSVSKIFVLKKSLSIGLDEIFWSRHSVYHTTPQLLVSFHLWRVPRQIIPTLSANPLYPHMMDAACSLKGKICLLSFSGNASRFLLTGTLSHPQVIVVLSPITIIFLLIIMSITRMYHWYWYWYWY